MTCIAVPSHVQLFAAPPSIACQAPLPVEVSKQEYNLSCDVSDAAPFSDGLFPHLSFFFFFSRYYFFEAGP